MLHNYLNYIRHDKIISFVSGFIKLSQLFRCYKFISIIQMLQIYLNYVRCYQIISIMSDVIKLSQLY